ncbi:unnamed protein product [Peronospora destructor]|uniref:Expansin-like EG45 domain-containing protein n=1 Tax=Peronospora destructor TaxID=86335 RepID=A0AAV0TVC4_9STRA|nr:unnamed protein product [Peronospora destructor]
MFRQISLLTMIMPAMAFAGDSDYFHGDATAYTLGQVSAGNCNFMYDPGVGHNYAALNSEQWDSTRNCGRCAEVSCNDSRCSKKSSTIVYIVDKCPECAKGSLDLSPTVFKQLTGSDSSRYTIQWKFVTCPVTGNINYCAKNGSSSSWLAVQPANHANGVVSMKIVNQEATMVDSCYYFLLKGGANVNISAVDIEITSVAGETITETLSLASDNCTVGTANFKTSTTQSTSQTPPAIPPTPISASVPTTPVATAPAVKTDTPITTMSSYTSTNGDSSQTEVTNPFGSLKTNSSSDSGAKYKSGSVIAASESGSEVKILQSSEVGVEKISSVQQEDESESSKQPAASDVEHVTTKANSKSLKTSTVVVAFIVLAVVCGIAFAIVVFGVKKKKLNDKRIDRDMAMMRSFDTFSSPVRFDETIAKV